MARKIVFTNSVGGVLTADFQGNPYAITSATGLGVPSVNLQTQKAPYQDGTTYIDTLLDNRQLSFELTINRPNNFTSIDTARRELVSKLNPKLGPGVLIYTTEGGTSYRINATVSAVTIPDKKYREPFLRCLVQLTANDPYWMDVADYTVSLPTKTTGSENTIASNVTLQSDSIIQLTNGNILSIYRRGSDDYLVLKTSTDNGVTWATETVINSTPGSQYSSVIQLADGNIFCAYVTAFPADILVFKLFTSSWGPETIINNAASVHPSVIQLADGNIFCAYRSTSSTFLVSKTSTDNGVTWGTETVINSANSGPSSVIQLADGNIFCAYTRGSDSYLVSKTSTDNGVTWGTETVINSAKSLGPSLILLQDESIFVIYTRLAIPGFPIGLGSRQYINGLWSNESVFVNTAYETANAIKLVNKSTLLQVNNNSYLLTLDISVTPVPAPVLGDVDSPIKVTFTGPSTNPRIINQDTLEFIRLNTTLAAGDTFVVNTAFGQKTIVLTKGGIASNGNAFLDIGSTFIQLSPGANTVYYEDDSELSTASASMVYTNRYAGI